MIGAWWWSVQQEDDTGAKVIAEVLEVKTMSDDTSTTHHQAEHGEKEKTIKRKTTETVAGELITSTTKGRAHPSDEGAKRIRRLDSVNLQATNHSLSETSPPSMPRKRPRRKPKRGKKGKQHEDSPSVKSSNGEEEKVEDDTWVPEAEMGMNGNGEDLPSKSKSEERKEEEEEEEDAWVDEPEVCAFCDDGVVEGETLLWYGFLSNFQFSDCICGVNCIQLQVCRTQILLCFCLVALL